MCSFLSWAEDKPDICLMILPDTFILGQERLTDTTNKLFTINFYYEYKRVVLRLLDDKITEEIPQCQIILYASYLSHGSVNKKYILLPFFQSLTQSQ